MNSHCKLLHLVTTKHEELRSIGKHLSGLPKGDEKTKKIARMKELQKEIEGSTKVIRRYDVTNTDVEPFYPFGVENWVHETGTGE